MTDLAQHTMAGESLKSLRKALFDEIYSLRNGDTTVSQSMAVSKLGAQIISSYKVEIDAVKTMNELKDKNLSYAATLSAIQTEDTKTNKTETDAAKTVQQIKEMQSSNE